MQALKNKRGIAALQGVILTIVFVALLLGVGLMLLDKFQSSLTEGSAAANATSDIITELAGIPTYIGIIIIVAIMGIIISYLLGWFGGRKTGSNA